MTTTRKHKPKRNLRQYKMMTYAKNRPEVSVLNLSERGTMTKKPLRDPHTLIHRRLTVNENDFCTALTIVVLVILTAFIATCDTTGTSHESSRQNSVEIAPNNSLK